MPSKYMKPWAYNPDEVPYYSYSIFDEPMGSDDPGGGGSSLERYCL